MPDQITIEVPGRVDVMRLFIDNEDEVFKEPASDSPQWISVDEEPVVGMNTQGFPEANQFPIFWIKGQNGAVMKAFRVRIPLFGHCEWVDRYVNRFLMGVAFWMPLLPMKKKKTDAMEHFKKLTEENNG
jgi:hypothetical protein